MNDFEKVAFIAFIAFVLCFIGVTLVLIKVT